jgi:hypothetical protein
VAVEVYECSGIRIASDIPLSAPLSFDQNGGLADVRLELGDARDQAFERPSDDIIAELTVEGYPWYTFCRVDDGYAGRIPGVADFLIDDDLKRVVCHPALDDRSKVIPIIVPGTVTAFLLAMSGRFVLHGSAVDLDGRALAFVGASGQGKTTMAAMFCAAGTTLVTDDVLPLEFGSGPDGATSVLCLRAGNELRLREKSASLADRFDEGTAVRVTADDRRAVMPLTTPHQRLPLAAVLLPRPDREHPDVSARLLSGGEASFWLGRCQRIEGWRGRDQLRQQFTDVGVVAATVPVFEVSVPWGPPFNPDLPQQVLDACDLTGSLRTTS